MAVAIVILGVSSSFGQDATASLRRIPQADIDAEGCEDGDCTNMQTVCLNSSADVLVAEPHPNVSEGVLAAVTWDNDEGSSGVIVSVLATAEWVWKPFIVNEPQCYQLSVLGGRARIYEMTMGVEW